MKRPALLVLLAACGAGPLPLDGGSAPVVDGGPSVASTCDWAGVWDLTIGGDGGTTCRAYAKPPSPLTITSDGSTTQVSGATALASDGGCGLTVRFDFPDPSPLDPFNRHQVFTLDFTADGGVAGDDRLSVDGYLNCSELAPLTGTRR